MPEYLSPGVYVEEIDTGNKPIEGVGTSTVGFVGVTERGPIAPRFITSFTEYRRVFGGYTSTGFLAHGVEGFFQNGGKRCFVARVTSQHDQNQPNRATSATTKNGGQEFSITAIGPGDWANKQLAFKVSPASLDLLDKNLFKLTVMYWDKAAATVLPTDRTKVIDPTDSVSMATQGRVEPTVLEVFDNLSIDKNSSDYYESRINDESILVTVKWLKDGRPKNEPPLPDAPAPGDPPSPLKAPIFLDGGKNGAPVSAKDFLGKDPDPVQAELRFGTGLMGLAAIDEIAILCSPDEHAVSGVTELILTQCETLKDRFAILQTEQDAGAVNGIRPQRESKYGALYYPWIRILDPITNQPKPIPPCGHVAGIYARSDIERGVHKAPANEVIRGLYTDSQDPAAGLQIQVNSANQDILNPRGVNVLRFFVGRGPLVWGARTMSRDPDWKYVNVRRLFIFVEESIDEATQWVVFEPNDEPLWARVRRSVSDFLTRLWMDGMLQGRSKEEAYFVKCDRTTMTQADIDNGKLIMVIGIAPVKPAEFVIFRIGQWTGGSEVTE